MTDAAGHGSRPRATPLPARAWRNGALVLGALSVAAIGSVWLAISAAERGAGLNLLMLPVVALALSTAALLWRTRIVVDDAGVHQFTPLASAPTTTPWAEIARVEPRDSRLGGHVAVALDNGSELALTIPRNDTDAVRDRRPGPVGPLAAGQEPLARTWHPRRHSTWAMGILAVALLLGVIETRSVGDNGPMGGLLIVVALTLALTAGIRSRLRVRVDADGLHVRRSLRLGELSTDWRQIARIATERGGRRSRVSIDTMDGDRRTIPIPAEDVSTLLRWHAAR